MTLLLYGHTVKNVSISFNSIGTGFMHQDSEELNNFREMVTKAYDENNPNRERDKSEVIKLLLGAFLPDLENIAMNIKKRYGRLLADEPGDIVNGFIIKELYETDALHDFLNYEYKNVFQFLYPVMRNYVIDTYKLRKKVVNIKQIAMSSEFENMADIKTLPPDKILEALEDEKQRRIKNIFEILEKQANKYPLEVDLFKKKYSEGLEYKDIIKSEGCFNYRNIITKNILSTHKRHIEQISLPGSKIGFKDKMTGEIITEEKAKETAINRLKKRLERFRKDCVLKNIKS